MMAAVYRLAPRYRRCALYGIVAMPFLGGAAYFVSRLIDGVATKNRPLPWSVFAVVAVLLLVALNWVLRVDDGGISRRRAFVWDRWNWSDFASGRIEKRGFTTFIDPDRPWWRSRLSLDYLDESEQRDLVDLINAHYRLPQPPEIGDELTIKYRLRHFVTFNFRGVRFLSRGESVEYRWKDVQCLHITRADLQRRDFRNLELVLPDREIELKFINHQHGTTQTWRGASPEELNEFLLAHVPSERIDVDRLGGCPAKVADVERQLREAHGQLRQLRICFWISLLFILGPLVWMVLDGRVLGTLSMAALSLPLFGGTYWFIRKEHRGKIQKLNGWLAEFESANSRR